MELSKEQLNKIYADKRNRHLSLFLGACEREIVNDEWGRPLSMSHQYLSDREIIGLVNWWKKKQSEQKYTVQVIKGNCTAFLNVDIEGDMFIGDGREYFDDRTRFTKQEIEKLKQRDDLAIDWNKVIIEPAGYD